MGQKINPKSFRTGVIIDWQSRWFPKKNWSKNLQEDVAVRQETFKIYPKSGIVGVEIERSGLKKIDVLIKTARPGLLIGRGGESLNKLKSAIGKRLLKIKKDNKERDLSLPTVNISVEEVKKPYTWAAVIAQLIANDIEKRIPFRRTVKKAIERVMQNKEVKGVKIQVSGRLDGSEISRSEWFREGSLPLNKLRAVVDYSHEEAHCTYGTVGIKVWIYKGEIL